MRSLIVFKVDNNRYAINIEKIERIMQAQPLTSQAGSSDMLDGVMSYQSSVIKIVNFRKLIHLEKFEDVMIAKFDALKLGHKEWINALKTAVLDDKEFTKTTDPHKCGLGIWLDSYRPYDSEVERVYSDLFHTHRELHEGAIEVFNHKKNSKDEALEWIENDVMNKYNSVITYLDYIQDNMDRVSLSLQKYLLYKDDKEVFGIKVDDVEDIVHIKDENIQGAKINGDMLDIDGVVEINNSLVTILGKVNIKKEVA